ncbi:hypothetical protein [uncultured Deinococcus sp.]|uniref:hypothetical protein n=1 Tax=uncultured Deinococcus sp. TaxID=158789 RepID=UPI0025828032|nr:hypothetical protein [uncultured Deinococcus sp.]
MSLTAPASPAIARPPSYGVGMLLSVFLPGAGMTYLGRWGWHLGWIGILLLLAVLDGVLAVVTGLGFSVLTFLGWIAQLVHYHRSYAAQAGRGFPSTFPAAGKIALIAAHVLLLVLPVFAAVLIPNLLSARQTATQAGEQAAARRLYLQVVTDQVDGRLSATCPQVTLPEGVEVTRCAVDIGDPEEPVLNVTFGSGHRLRLP